MKSHWIRRLLTPPPAWTGRASVILGLLVFVVLSGLDSLGVDLDGWKRYVMIAGVAGICYFFAGYIDKRIPRKSSPM
ncbi:MULTISPECIES: hypothetical protein [Serratia]|uniref:DUF4175 domain-containing protein n=1 Tax=Serratia nematodiphila TaxID=458197 RepID=A0A1G5IWY1_9GAMM|nr:MULTISPECIES: hypothetical protein [Serratia]KMJ12350.1 hypothetical protein SN04_03458 [Serratia marcescens]MBH2773958.1 hypothetical protein [Serratia marcescens]MBM1297926.1 hypothetical protein [Serratia nematodiphila]MBN5316097.1 hypothetical protein [Serratia marcescens]MCI2401534.1 hypothetical protein [Serratia sp. PGPR-27]